jgi:hypothetical protein
MSTRLLTSFGPRRLTRHVMLQTIYIFTSFSRIHNMSFLPVTSQMSHILEFLEVSTIFLKRVLNLQNLPLKYMKNFCLVMTQTCEHIVFSTRTLVVLKPHMTQCLMRLLAPKWSNIILML